MTEIKICGLFREADVDAVNRFGPDYIGFILNYPRSHRNITGDQAAGLRARLRPGIGAVGVFVNQPCEEIAALAKTIGLSVIQLHGAEDNETILRIKTMTGLPVWKAFRVRNASDLTAAAESAADLVLLDGGTGSGVAFDWSLLSAFTRPFILAGGLTPELIGEAIRRLSPKIVDLSSGVETDRVKDPEKIRRAVLAAHGH
ncbi:MAG: phosphoribosylanthranilate isomerase [Clostridia bacterium]|nr:phosphoribosylanthranilate isomerase [Clostridia bacterium]